MDRFGLFMQKVKSDEKLLARLDELGKRGAAESEVVAFAAENGFTVTEDDVREARRRYCPHHGKLNEQELEHIAGGYGTENRWNPAECRKYREVHYWCVGFMELFWCDHYVKTRRNLVLQHKCAMGVFDYKEDIPDFY